MARRSVDSFMRVLIPPKIMKKLRFEPEQEIEISMEYGVICIRKFEPENFKERPYVGIIRKIDTKTRVTIPRSYAHLMGIKKGDKVEIKEVRGVIKIL